MSSTTARPSYGDRRANGGAYSEKAGSGGAGVGAGAGASRPRMSAAHDSFRSDRSEPRYRDASSPQPSAYSSGTSHKRSASGNPRPTSRTTTATTSTSAEERRNERAERIERTERTERTHITTREVLVSRTRSPERRAAPVPAKDRTKAAEAAAKARPAETRTREPKEAAPQAPWNPEATLLPHTSAPLASRISIPPLASQVPPMLQAKPLHTLSIEAQEAVILEDLLYVFMGFEGQYIRFAKGYNPAEERDRLSGPTWRILPGLDPSLQDLTVAMLKMATYYSALETFVDVQSREEFGSVNHALCASIRKFLQDYLVLIAQLETQFLTSDSFTLHVLHIHVLPTIQMMFQLYALAHELLKKNALLDDESDDSSDSGDDYNKILDQLREGGDLVPGSMAGKKICKGGVVLGLITKRLEAMSGDPAARALLTTLLRDASRPYVTMLNEWLHHGGISDPHSEFLIKEQKSIRRERLEQDYTDEYWERRYTIRDHDVPPQLEGVKDKVLLAGKYLNVVRECGGVDISKEVMDVPTSFDDNRFLDNINRAYAHANESLMQLLLTTHALPGRLRSLKHYFFLDPSDYFSYFLELGTHELRKKTVKAINIGKLQSLLDLVLRQPGSVVSLDPFKEDVKVEMNEITLLQSLQRVVNITGIEQGETLQPSANQPADDDKRPDGFTSLQLDYAVPFPVSLVISRKTIWRYQALFRFLLSLRYVEWQLSLNWQAHTRDVPWTHKSSSREVGNWKRRLWTLRARMMLFVQQLLYFCTAEVIEPNWQALMSRLKAKEGSAGVEGGGSGGVEAGASAGTAAGAGTGAGAGAGAGGSKAAGASGPSRTVDELMQDHVDFLDTCLKECMLTNSTLLRIHAKLIEACKYFAHWTANMTRGLEIIDPDLNGPTRPSNMREQDWKAFQQKLAQRQQSPLWREVPAYAGKSREEVRAFFVEKLEKLEHNFGKNLQVLLDALNHYAATETVVLLGLCARLHAGNHGSRYADLKHEAEFGV